MGLRDIWIKIKGKDDSRRAINQASGNVERMGRKTSDVTRLMARGFRTVINVIKGIGVVGVATMGFVGAAVKKAFDFEAYQVQFKTLLGSMDAAKKRFKDLQEFSAQTPFQLAELIESSKQVENLSGGLLDNKRTLTLTGDAAAALGKNIQEVSYWYSRFYAMTRGGQATGEERRRLLELGIISAETATKLKKMADAGEPLAKQMAIMNEALSKFKGGMGDLSRTGNGLISTLKDNWTLALATFGAAFVDASKTGISGMIDTLQKLRTDGTIEEWGKKAKETLDTVIELGKALKAGGPEAEDAKSQIKKIAEPIVEALVAGGERIGEAILRGMMRQATKPVAAQGPGIVAGAVGKVTEERTGSRIAGLVAKSVVDANKRIAMAAINPLGTVKGAASFVGGGGVGRTLAQIAGNTDKAAKAAEGTRQDLNK